MKVVQIYFVFLCLWCGVKARCSMYGQCYEINGHPKPCPFPEEPLPIVQDLSSEETENVIAILEHRCPHLLYDEEGNRKPDNEVLTCCDHRQMIMMDFSFLMVDGVLGNCPTCVRNFVRQVCEMQCSPDQSRFVNIHTEEAPNGVEYVNEIDYRVYEDFMIGAHASCSGVTSPQTGLPAIHLMCGAAPVCDADAWFGFTGDYENNPLVPVQVNFQRWPTTEDSMNVHVTPCHETAEGDIPCTCTDCAAICPEGGEPPRCVMRGECYEIDGHPKPCRYSGEPLPILEDLSPEESENVIALLEHRCPHLIFDEDGNRKPDVLTCCDHTQILKMSESLSMIDDILGNCPTCARNYARHVCEMICSPEQSRFINVLTEIADNDSEYVNEINYRLYEEFMVDAHASCAGVIDRNTGRPAINLMCGDVTVCDVDSWFEYAGDYENNPLAPVQVNIRRWPTPEDSMNARAPPCHETAEGEAPCSCIDCAATCPEDQPHCVMRGECYEVNNFPKICPYSGPPLPVIAGASEEVAEQVIAIVESRCPHLLYDEIGVRKRDSEVVACCDYVQLLQMANDLLMADGVLGRCPTCVRNFARQVCELNCSPEQSRFINVTIEIAENGTEYVNEVDYRLYEDFMLGAHMSCSGVLVPQTGLPAINLMCGNAPVCDAEAWFRFMGDTQNNPLAPVQVNFLRWPTPEDSMNVRAPACNETAEGDIPCSCIDCAPTCPAGIEPVVPEVCTIMTVNCISFSVSLVFFVFTVIVFLFLTRLEYKRSSENVKPATKKSGNKVIQLFQSTFSHIGMFSASNPQLIIMLTTWVMFAMLFGVMNLNVTSNPIELWSAPDSRSRAELNYFNSRFGPFYRAAQVFLQIKGLEPFTVGDVTFGPAYRLEAIQELVDLEDAIIDLGRDNGGVTLEQVCFAPLRMRGAEQRLDECVTMSVSTYLGDDRDNINNNTYLNRIQNCLNNYMSLSCMASWGGGSDPEITFGGYEGDDILSADTLLINLPIANFLLEDDLRPVLEWEQKFIDLLHDYATKKPDFIDLSFGAERSIEDEIQRVSVAEAVPISISYFLMFIYVTISLGNIRNCRTWFIDSKIVVAISSILIVLVSIFCAIGVMGYAGITVTLLAVNVIPFFVLSVGIDNVFLMVNTLHDVDSKLKEFDEYNENLSFRKRRNFVFRKMMERVGPSMFVSSVTHITCFGIGSLANFPAVVTFAIFASLSLAFLFVFQVTTVVAILALDYKRSTQNRFDILCCIQKKVLNDEDPLNSDTPHQSLTSKLMAPYSKFILNWKVKIAVAILFMTFFCVCVIFIPQIEIGLDQEMALPVDSYVYKYLQSVNQLMIIGPPVYFVLKDGLNFTDPYHQNVICGGQLCYDDSLATQIFLASQFTNVTYISRSSNSWIDDFFDWSNLFGACCKYNTSDGTFCQSTDNSPECAYCTIERGEWQNGLRPAIGAFETYIPFFLLDTPTEICNKGGLASYFNSVNYLLDSQGRASVHDTNFMAYHSTLETSKDYITAVKYGYEISANITAAIKRHTDLDVEVFPYSVFYVFFEQYLTMWEDTFASIGYCLIGAFVFNLLASGFNFLTTFAVIFTAIMVLLDMMGIMYFWNIPLNAVSCVNLIVSIGIAVEFCSHISYAFATSSSEGDQRIVDALKSVGPTIITGITFTNIPIIVLAFSYTQIIEVFFFRMFFSLVILGFFHGMVFFPVFLSFLSNMTASCKCK